MNYIYPILFCFFLGCSAIADDKLTGKVDLSYTYGSKREALIETLRIGFKYNVYEHPRKSYLLYFGGNALTEHDMFQRISKVNGFFVLGVEY